MKTRSILFWMFLFGGTVARTMTDGEIEGRKHATSNPSFIWKTPLGLHVVYPNGQEDYINLQPVLTSSAPVKCLFRGQFYRDPSSSAVISGCMEDDVVSITIVAKELWGRTAFQVTKGMVEEVENPYAGDFDEDYEDVGDENGDQVVRDKRSIYEDYQDYEYTDYQFDGGDVDLPPPPPLLTTPLRLAFDKSFKTKMGSEEAAKTYIRSVAELGSPYLENFSPQTKIFLNIMDEIEFFDEILEPSAAKLHRAFELKTQEAVLMVIFTSKEDNNKKSGISPGLPGKACDAKKGVSIVKRRSNKNLAAMTFAHEVGHEHGMKHDLEETPSCRGEGIMSVIGKDLSLSQRPTTFSSCSVARFAKWYRNFGIQCMQEVIACRGGATLLSTSPRGDMVLCKDKTESTCQKDFESLCPAGWNLCHPKQFNNRNTGWDYNWADAKAGRPFGVIYCYSGSGGTARHYGIRSNPVLSTDQPLNCGWTSSRPGCERWAGWGDCDHKDKSALCCAPTSTCGDGLVQQEEDCDDGNDSNLDDCLNSCTWRKPGDHGLSGCP